MYPTSCSLYRKEASHSKTIVLGDIRGCEARRPRHQALDSQEPGLQGAAPANNNTSLPE